MANKLPYVQETFRSLNEETVDQQAMGKVNKLLKDGYKVKVTIQKPIIHTYAGGDTHAEFITNIQATLSSKVEMVSE